MQIELGEMSEAKSVSSFELSSCGEGDVEDKIPTLFI